MPSSIIDLLEILRITTYKLNKKNPLKLYNITKDILEEFEDIKGVIRIQISKKNRQHNDQKKKYKTYI
jgi:hypothetical protein